MCKYKRFKRFAYQRVRKNCNIFEQIILKILLYVSAIMFYIL